MKLWIACSFCVVKLQLYLRVKSQRPLHQNQMTIMFNNDDDDLKSDQLQALTCA